MLGRRPPTTRPSTTSRPHYLATPGHAYGYPPASHHTGAGPSRHAVAAAAVTPSTTVVAGAQWRTGNTAMAAPKAPSHGLTAQKSSYNSVPPPSSSVSSARPAVHMNTHPSTAAAFSRETLSKLGLTRTITQKMHKSAHTHHVDAEEPKPVSMHRNDAGEPQHQQYFVPLPSGNSASGVHNDGDVIRTSENGRPRSIGRGRGGPIGNRTNPSAVGLSKNVNVAPLNPPPMHKPLPREPGHSGASGREPYRAPTPPIDDRIEQLSTEVKEDLRLTLNKLRHGLTSTDDKPKSNQILVGVFV